MDGSVLRAGYVRAVRWVGARPPTQAALRRWAGTGSAAGRHARSLFAVHDVAALAALDLAWWTYPAQRHVDRLLAARGGSARVFEYGSGASTVWLARRCAEVVSVEHDPRFATAVAALLPRHAQLRLVPAPASGSPVEPSARRDHRMRDFAEYVATIDQVDGVFDLVVVDGRARMACVARALPRLAPGGVVLLDDFHRPRYRRIANRLPVTVTEHLGWVPTLPVPGITALLRPTHQG